MSVKMVGTNEAHEAFRQEILWVMRRHGAGLRADEMLAIASNIVGMLLAHQDPTRYSVDLAMEVILRNIELGNQQIVQQIADLAAAPVGGRA